MLVLGRVFHTWKGPDPQTQVGTVRCTVPAACSGGTACVVPGSVGPMPRGERSAPERRGDAAAPRPYRRAESGQSPQPNSQPVKSFYSRLRSSGPSEQFLIAERD